MTTNVFDQAVNANQDQGTQDGTPPQTQASTTDVFGSLVGPDKKFKSPEDLVRGKLEADNFITQLQREMQELREELNKRTTAQEIADNLKKELAAGVNEVTTPSLKPEDISKQVEQLLNAKEEERFTLSNLKQTSDSLLAQYGDKAAEVIKTRAEELGVAVEYLKDTAARSPKAFYQMMGMTPKDTGPSSYLQRNGNNSTAYTGKSEQEQWKEYFTNLRKDKPKDYHSPKVQQQLFQLVKEGRFNPSI